MSKEIPLDPANLKSEISLIVSVVFITISSFKSDGVKGYLDLVSSILIILEEKWFNDEISR